MNIIVFILIVLAFCALTEAGLTNFPKNDHHQPEESDEEPIHRHLDDRTGSLKHLHRRNKKNKSKHSKRSKGRGKGKGKGKGKDENAEEEEEDLDRCAAFEIIPRKDPSTSRPAPIIDGKTYDDLAADYSLWFWQDKSSEEKKMDQPIDGLTFFNANFGSLTVQSEDIIFMNTVASLVWLTPSENKASWEDFLRSTYASWVLGETADLPSLGIEELHRK